MILHGDPVELPNRSAFERILENCQQFAEEFPEKNAFITAENQFDSITFQQVCDYTKLISEWFVDNGFHKGDVILLAVNNNWRFVVTAFGAWRAGLIVSSACPQFTPYEMHYQIDDSLAKLIVVDETTRSTVIKAIREIKNPIRIVTLEQSHTQNLTKFNDLISRKVKNLAMPMLDIQNDLMVLPYSSGTTGKPKGVMISHQNMSIALSITVQRFKELAVAQGLPDDFSLPYDLHFLPLYHAMGMFRALQTMFRGTTQIMFGKFDMELMLQSVEKFKIFSLTLVPAILVRMVSSPLMRKYDLSSLANIVIGSAPLPEGAVQKIRQILPDVKLVHGYGMTELTFASHLPAADSPEKSVGRVTPGTSMKVLKEDGTLCGVGETGECWIRSPQIMRGYWRKEHLMRDLIDADGFMRTGDIVYFDANGDTYICDRAKELIKVNAKQVAPAELESLLLEHDEVADACVFGVEDAMNGEKPVACIVAKADKGRVSEKIARQIVALVNKNLARYKHIKEIHLVEQISRTATGKILRRNMRKQFLDSRKSHI